MNKNIFSRFTNYIMNIKWKSFLKNTLLDLLFIIFILDFCFQGSIIPTGSMIKTLFPGDVIAVKKWTYGYNNSSFFLTRLIKSYTGVKIIKGTFFKKAVKRGDIVAFEYETGQIYCKRAIAVGGDTVKMENGTWYVNNKPFTQTRAGFYEYYDGDDKVKTAHFTQNTDGVIHSVIKESAEGGPNSRFVKEIIIPEGYIWCIGDNMDGSYDSRFFGPVDVNNLLGNVVIIFASIGMPKIDSSKVSNFAFIEVVKRAIKLDYKFFQYVWTHSKSERAFTFPK